VLGGGMRQAGILAAAGIIALTDHVERLAEDHANAQLLAGELSQIEEISVDPWSAQTNMVFISLKHHTHEKLAGFLKPKGILIMPRYPIRLVTHLDVTRKDINMFIEAVKAFFTAESR
jgi:threonine aldolase